MLLPGPVSRVTAKCKLGRRHLAETSHVSLFRRGFIEVSKVTRAKEADDKGSPFLSEEEQSAAEVDSATEVGYGVCEGGSVASAAEVGSNAAEVV